jgi:hypothetical protein
VGEPLTLGEVLFVDSLPFIQVKLSFRVCCEEFLKCDPQLLDFCDGPAHIFSFYDPPH